jgi:hypothetical protein
MLSDMDLSHFDTMDAAELRSYLAFLLWHYRVVDGFWFLYMTHDYDLPAAERLNERVWARVSGLATRDLVSRFAITEKGLEGFAKVLRLYPWTALLEYQVEESPDEIVLTVPCCATQEARRRRGDAGVSVPGDAPSGVPGHGRGDRLTAPGALRLRTSRRAAGRIRLPLAVHGRGFVRARLLLRIIAMLLCAPAALQFTKVHVDYDSGIR